MYLHMYLHMHIHMRMDAYPFKATHVEHILICMSCVEWHQTGGAVTRCHVFLSCLYFITFSLWDMLASLFSIYFSSLFSAGIINN